MKGETCTKGKSPGSSQVGTHSSEGKHPRSPTLAHPQPPFPPHQYSLQVGSSSAAAAALPGCSTGSSSARASAEATTPARRLRAASGAAACLQGKQPSLLRTRKRVQGGACDRGRAHSAAAPWARSSREAGRAGQRRAAAAAAAKPSRQARCVQDPSAHVLPAHLGAATTRGADARRPGAGARALEQRAAVCLARTVCMSM